METRVLTIPSTLLQRLLATLVLTVLCALLATETRAGYSQQTVLTHATLRDALVVLDDAAGHGIDVLPESILAIQQLATAARSSHVVLYSAATEAVLVDALLRYAADFTIGSRKPDNDEITALRDEVVSAVRSGDLLSWYYAKIPPSRAYNRLLYTYHQMKQTSDTVSWPYIDGRKTLEPGDEGERVGLLRERLGLATTGVAVFDQELETAVRQYQSQHGLDVDGKAGPRTLAHLNTSYASRLRQIRRNLERHRRQWSLNFQEGPMRLYVNLPSYQLTLYDDQGELTTMKVIVGHPKTPTPTFAESIDRLEFSPYWYVPASIARKEILPAMRANPNYGKRNRYEILERKTFRRLSDAEWQSGAVSSFVVRQRPGDKNALGRVKFVLPNTRAIYLHDTSSPQLFSRQQRALSHGCIRVEKPALLASLLLQANDGWTEEEIARAMNRRTPKAVKPSITVDVITTYYTAETLPNGETAFYEDIYDKDVLKPVAMASSFIEPVPPYARRETLVASVQ